MIQWVENFRVKMYQRNLAKKLASQRIQRNPISFDKAKTVGLLVDATDRENHVFADKYRDKLRSLDKRVKILAFFNDKELHDNILVDYFTQKNLNWYHHPEGRTVDDFIKKPFDILISLHQEPSMPLEYISAMSNAQMRVGQYAEDKEYCYDFMIDTAGESDGMTTYVEQIDHFLKIINVNV